jgi:hypothetical protein
MMMRIASYIKRQHLAMLASSSRSVEHRSPPEMRSCRGTASARKQVIDGSLLTSDLSKTARTAL